MTCGMGGACVRQEQVERDQELALRLQLREMALLEARGPAPSSALRVAGCAVLNREGPARDGPARGARPGSARHGTIWI